MTKIDRHFLLPNVVICFTLYTREIARNHLSYFFACKCVIFFRVPYLICIRSWCDRHIWMVRNYNRKVASRVTGKKFLYAQQTLCWYLPFFKRLHSIAHTLEGIEFVNILSLWPDKITKSKEGSCKSGLVLRSACKHRDICKNGQLLQERTGGQPRRAGARKHANEWLGKQKDIQKLPQRSHHCRILKTPKNRWFLDIAPKLKN